MLSILVDEARRCGAQRLIGEYIPSPKNAMVRDHYERVGFRKIDRDAAGSAYYELRIEDYAAPDLPMVVEGSGIPAF